MQLLKISFILSLVGSLCSFAYYSANEDGRERLYKDFLSRFEQIDLPSTVSLEAYVVTNEMKPEKRQEQLKKAQSETEMAKVLTQEYATFIPDINHGMMSRMGPGTYKAELALTTTGKYSAVIYSESHIFNAGAKLYILATFDGNGTRIGLNHLGYSDLEEQTELTINEKMELTIKHLMIKGDVKTYDEEKTEKMFITPKGEILVHENIKPSNIEPQQKTKTTLKFS